MPNPADAPPEPDDASPLDGRYRADAAWLRARLAREFGRSLPEQVEDLVHESFLRVAAQAARRGAAALRSPRAFLLQVGRRLALDALRRRRREDAYALDPAALPRSADLEQLTRVKQTILALPPDLRDVFLLVRVEGLPQAEAAQRCGVSVKTVEWRLAKAMALCAQALRDS